VNTSDTASNIATRTQTGLVKGVLGVGALGVVASVLLIIGALTTNTMAGEDWQPAGVLGAIGLCLGGTVLMVGLLAHFVVTRPGRR
jgi:hypothetical protein